MNNALDFETNGEVQDIYNNGAENYVFTFHGDVIHRDGEFTELYAGHYVPAVSEMMRRYVEDMPQYGNCMFGVDGKAIVEFHDVPGERWDDMLYYALDDFSSAGCLEVIHKDDFVG